MSKADTPQDARERADIVHLQRQDLSVGFAARLRRQSILGRLEEQI
jgi:hypothetical protein